MESLLQDIISLLVAVGPEVVFLVAMAETAFFIGLLIPAEATVLVAAFLAERGTFDLMDVLLATILGGFAGDQIGYALGRFGGARYAAREGRLGRMWRRHEPRAVAMFANHSLVSVSLARFVSFVRTLMPWFAGMSRVPYGRFVLFDLLGVAGWGGASVAAGYLAGGSWRRVADAMGTTSAIMLLLVVLILVWAAIKRNRSGPVAADIAPEPPGPPETSEAPR